MQSSIIKIKCPNCKQVFEYIIPQKLPRSNPQNRYFHGVVIPILSEHTGHTPEECKEIVKSLFLKKETTIKTKTGLKNIKYVKGTSKLRTDEFEIFMERVRIWASVELGCYIPLPNEEMNNEM